MSDDNFVGEWHTTFHFTKSIVILIFLKSILNRGGRYDNSSRVVRKCYITESWA